MKKRRRDPGGRASQHGLREWLEKGVVLVDGDEEGAVDVDDKDPVFVAIAVNVQGYGPHAGVIYAQQNRYHASHDSVMQAAVEILEQWMMDHDADYLAELEAEYEEEYEGRAFEVFTETIDAVTFKLTPKEFAAAIRGTDAEKYLNVYSSKEES